MCEKCIFTIFEGVLPPPLQYPQNQILRQILRHFDVLHIKIGRKLSELWALEIGKYAKYNTFKCENHF